MRTGSPLDSACGESAQAPTALIHCDSTTTAVVSCRLWLYLQPEPKSADPEFVAYLASRGRSLPAYSYALSNPIANSDPTGLYVLHGQCGNWLAGLALAKKWAGCDAKGKGTSCKCQSALTAAGGCDICQFLQDGSGPDAFLKDWGVFDADAHTNVGSTGLSYADHTEPDSVAFKKSRCDDPLIGTSNVKNLAEYMIHEAMHYCEKVTGKPFLDGYVPKPSGPEALAPQCRDWGGR